MDFPDFPHFLTSNHLTFYPLKGWFLLGVLLSALFQRYVPADGFAKLFGESNEGFGVLMAATIGVLRLRRRDDTAYPRVALFGHEHGQRCGVYADGAVNQDNELRRAENRPRH